MPKLMFDSKYSDCKINTAKFLVEMICEHRANKNKEILTKKFWQHPQWKKTYVVQIQMAYNLLNIYDEALLVKLVRQYKILTLNSKFLESKLEEESTKIKPAIISKSEQIVESQRPLKTNKTRKKLEEL